MVSLAVIVLEMLVDHTSQMLFSEKDHSIASNGVNSTESRRFEIHWQVNPAIDDLLQEEFFYEVSKKTDTPANHGIQIVGIWWVSGRRWHERDLGNRWHFFLDNRWGWAAGAVGLGNYSDFVCGILA